MEPVAVQVCSRVRAYVSLEVDGELSELEASILDAHVADCAACRAFRASVSDSTAALRSAPAEVVAHSFYAPARRSRLAALSASATAAAAAAAVAAVAVVGAGFSSVLSPADGNRSPGVRTTAPSSADLGPSSIRALDSWGGSGPFTGMRVL